MLRSVLFTSILLTAAIPWPGTAFNAEQETMFSTDLKTIRSESNPEKRASKALEQADRDLRAAKEAYIKGDDQETDAAIQGLAQAVQLSYESLRATGKDPSKSPKHFKKAEIKTRELLKKIDDFRNLMSEMDRARVDDAREVVDRVHEDLLLGVMGSKESTLRTKK